MKQPNLIISVPSVVAPAPWNLKGNGYVFLFRYSKEFLQKNAFLRVYQQSHLKLRLGAIMLLDYQNSNVGPYRELVFIPGIFKLSGHYAFSISKIYVSSLESQWNGQENWGIPKEIADFEIIQTDDSGKRKDEKWVVSQNGNPFFSVNLHRYGLKFPVGTTFIPFRIGQVMRDTLLITDPSFAGKGQLVRTADWFIDSTFFPDTQLASLLVGFSIRDFNLTFPVPRMFKAD